jgi:hypothetical protein
MHHSNGRLATRVLVPDAIPERALARYGIRSPKLIRYPGLKEEYYLADYPPDPGVAGELGLDPGKVIVVLTWCASLFSAVFFPFKLWSAYKYRRGKLEAKGVRPTLKHLIFFRTALARAVSLQPLIGSAGGGDFDTKPSQPSSNAPSASGGAAAGEAAHSAISLQTSQLDAVLRVNADLQQKQLEQERKFKEQEQRNKEQEQRNKEQEQRLKEQEQRMKEQERAIAALQQSASPPTPSAHRDDA